MCHCHNVLFPTLARGLFTWWPERRKERKMTRHIRTRICFSNIDDNRIFQVIYLILILLSFTVLTISEVVKGRSTLSEGIYCKIKKISVFFGPGLQHFKLMPRMPSTRNLVEPHLHLQAQTSWWWASSRKGSRWSEFRDVEEVYDQQHLHSTQCITVVNNENYTSSQMHQENWRDNYLDKLKVTPTT